MAESTSIAAALATGGFCHFTFAPWEVLLRPIYATLFDRKMLKQEAFFKDHSEQSVVSLTQPMVFTPVLERVTQDSIIANGKESLRIKFWKTSLLPLSTSAT